MGKVKRAVLFDYGGTLVHFYERHHFPAVLRAAIIAAGDELGLEVGPSVWARVEAEDYEAADYRVRPLEQRLGRIFGLDPAGLDGAAQAFTAVIRRWGRTDPAARAVTGGLAARGLRLGLVSNTPWGSPAGPWRDDLEERGLARHFAATVFCRDVGYRKPAPDMIAAALARLEVAPGDCLLVGDDPRWDLAGARRAGVDAVLVGPRGKLPRLDEVLNLPVLKG